MAKKSRGKFQSKGQWLRTSTRLKIYARDGYTCQRCGRDMSREPRTMDGPLTVDHVVPRQEGGGNEPSNLATCCRSCNSKNIGSKEPGEIMVKNTGRNLVPAKAKHRQFEIRDRIIGFERIASEELLDHQGNPRRHPNAQKNAMAGVLEEIGVVGALVIYKSERTGDRWVVIDGHMRKNDFPLEGGWPCLITDLADAEADLILQAYDQVSSLALVDRRMLDQLRQEQEFIDAGVRVMLDSIDDGLGRKLKKLRGELPGPEGDSDGDEDAEEDEAFHLPEMELQPYEHYDYVLALFRTTFDWNWIVERLGLQQVNGGTHPRFPKIGLGRAIPGDKLIALIRAGDEAIEKLAKLEAKRPKKEAAEGA